MVRAPRQQKSAVTIRTVARHAGVSAMTVSNVLSGKKLGTPETRAAVFRAIEELNYRPNTAARQLASASALSIGLLHGNIEQSFFSEILVGVLNAAAREGAQILLERVDFMDASAPWQAIRSLRDRGASGVLLPPYIAEQVAHAPEATNDLPLFAIAPGEELPGIASVRIDDFAAARDLTSLLISRGRKRIGFIGPPAGLALSARRRDGYLEALRAHGLQFLPELMTSGAVTVDANIAAAETLLDLAAPPDAIFAWNDDIAACALIAAHKRGLNVPQDLAVAGFDDNPLAIKVWPALTTIRQPVGKMAALALEKLAQQIRHKGGTETPPATTFLSYTLIERASTGGN